MADEGDKPSASEDALFAELARAPDVVPSSLLVGTALGRYAIESVLGRGGMGVVYRARDTTLERDVALKLVPPEVLGDPERRARFVREARSGAAVNHPNIAAVYDVGEIDGHVFLAMQLVEGESLRARLAQGPLTTEEAIAILRGIARGLAKAHEKGVIHRDLKPDNVMVGESLHVTLLDFGLAKLRAEKATDLAFATTTVEGRVLGTPAYMSPEQARGRALDARSDLFSLGVVCHEMLTGERPFRGDSTIEILSAVIRDPPPALPDSIAAPLRAIIDRCLEKEPAQRYASAKELLVELDGSPSSSSQVSSHAHGRVAAASQPPPPKKPVSRLRVAITGAAIIVGSAVVYRLQEEPRPAVLTVEAHAGRAITDHPKPPSSSPAALAAYTSALQNVRDGSLAFGAQELERATRLDPALAAAHLRILVVGLYALDASKVREHFAAASQHRAALDDRDVALLQATEELTREHPDRSALADKMTAVAERFPDDAEVAWISSSFSFYAGRTTDAKIAIRRARALDPSFAAALWFEASIVKNEDPDQALKFLDECLTISPSAASCLRVRATVRVNRGDCAGVEADARRMTEIEPLGPRAYEYLAAALAARGAPLDSIRAALDKRASLGAAGTREAVEMRGQADLWVALLAGDFPAAETAARALDRLYDNDSTEAAHVMPTLTLIDIYAERGDNDRALALAEAFARRVPAWQANAPTGVRARLVELRQRAGKIDDKEAEAARDTLLDESKEIIPAVEARQAAYRWFSIEAQYVGTESEAKAALAREPADSHVRGFDLWARGKVELLAGKRKEGAASLGAALKSCTAMPTTDDPFARLPFAWVEAELLLGDALDDQASCAAYSRVIDRWKDARPRSVSVEKARSRAKARGC